VRTTGPVSALRRSNSLRPWNSNSCPGRNLRVGTVGLRLPHPPAPRPSAQPAQGPAGSLGFSTRLNAGGRLSKMELCPLAPGSFAPVAAAKLTLGRHRAPRNEQCPHSQSLAARALPSRTPLHQPSLRVGGHGHPKNCPRRAVFRPHLIQNVGPPASHGRPGWRCRAARNASRKMGVTALGSAMLFAVGAKGPLLPVRARRCSGSELPSVLCIWFPLPLLPLARPISAPGWRPMWLIQAPGKG